MLKCITHISTTAEESWALERGCSAEVQVYSDGSGLNNRAGAATVLYREGKSPRTLRYSLGELMEHTTFEVEAVGVLLAVHLLRRTPNVRKATIRLDSQAVIQLLDIHKPRPAQYLTDKII